MTSQTHSTHQVQNLTVPPLGESVTEATVIGWSKEVGQTFERDEVLLELETDKVTLEVPAPGEGKLLTTSVKAGEKVIVGQVLGEIQLGSFAPSQPAATSPEPAEAPAQELPQPKAATVSSFGSMTELSPAVRKLVAENQLEPEAIPGTGKGGRLTKKDVLAHLQPAAPSVAQPSTSFAPEPAPAPMRESTGGDVERVPMTRLRQTIAQRLKDSQNTAAMLTTFNEVDMSAVIAARARLKDRFEKKYGLKLGFMSFFVKACLLALREIPEINATIDGNEIVYKNFYNIGVAVGTPQGLVVPVVRQVQSKSFATIEQEIADLAAKARSGKLSVADLSDGTFTISNGGVYGSLLSTPILNPPQSGILGMHKIEKRPVVIEDQVVVRPMMYLALTYDHRLIDGQQAVTFLVRVKECLEDLERILLEI